MPPKLNLESTLHQTANVGGEYTRSITGGFRDLGEFDPQVVLNFTCDKVEKISAVRKRTIGQNNGHGIVWFYQKKKNRSR